MGTTEIAHATPSRAPDKPPALPVLRLMMLCPAHSYAYGVFIHLSEGVADLSGAVRLRLGGWAARHVTLIVHLGVRQTAVGLKIPGQIAATAAA